MLAELRALRAAAGVGDDGEELPDIDEAAVTNDSSTNANLTSRLIKANKAAEAAKRVAEDMESFRKTAQERLERIEQLESEALEADATRRKLHNQIQELRGNVRVFCRVRPTTSDTAIVDCAPDGTSVELKKTDADVAGFEFDRVFGPSSTQGEVFHEVSQLVQSALDGYKVCLFSYGQTGSGKTHTMLGDQHNEETRGIIPRAVAKVVEASQANAKKGWKYRMCASYVEIYNEQVRDLLKAGSGHSDKHSIVHVDGVTEVSGVNREPVESVDAAAGLVRRAAAARAVEATQMNAVSSRSHTIFMLYITGEHEASGSRLTGCLNLVDLAGSERVGRSGAEGARLKEACAINKSLSCLGDVFQALSNGQKHIPYRNSKLTYLLQPCLGGDGKTLMFVNINPEAPSAEESMCSLKFASQVNAVELGRGGAKRNIVSGIGSKKEDSSKEDSNSAGGKKTDADKKGTIKGGKRPATARTAIGAAKKAKR
jgi:kinesin family protein C1